jgi:hypothetical protein
MERHGKHSATRAQTTSVECGQGLVRSAGLRLAWLALGAALGGSISCLCPDPRIVNEVSTGVGMALRSGNPKSDPLPDATVDVSPEEVAFEYTAADGFRYRVIYDVEVSR